MGSRAKHREDRSRAGFVCPCPAVCGVNKSHDQIAKSFYARHGEDEYTRSIHRKYKMWGQLYWR